MTNLERPCWAMWGTGADHQRQATETEHLQQREAMLEDLLRYMLRCSDEHVWPTSRIEEVRAVLGEQGEDGSG